jgi:hypothetical protein
MDTNVTDKRYEVIQYWGGWDESYIKDTETVTRRAMPYWIVVVNRKVLLRGDRNPYNHQLPPYCRIRLFPNQKPSWHGVGTGKIGKPTQDRLNKIVNQRLDNVDLVLNKQGAYNGNDPLINVKKLQISEPGQWHKCSDPISSFRYWDIPDVTGSAYKEEELAKQDYRESTGAVQQLMPGEDPQHRTATGINMLQGAAGMRFKPVLKQMELDLVQQGAMFFFSNLQQFMPREEWIMLTSDNGRMEPFLVTPQMLQVRANFIPTGLSETANKEAMLGQLLRFKEVTMQDPTVNRQEINKRIAELFGFKDIQKLLVPIEQPMGGGPLSGQEQLAIQQRLAEGATPDQIKQELLGSAPQPQRMM